MPHHKACHLSGLYATLGLCLTERITAALPTRSVGSLSCAVHLPRNLTLTVRVTRARRSIRGRAGMSEVVILLSCIALGAVALVIIARFF